MTLALPGRSSGSCKGPGRVHNGIFGVYKLSVLEFRGSDAQSERNPAMMAFWTVLR